jgi:hypothetical protein
MRNAIALLVTLFFLMAITVSIGIGLKYINGAKSTIEDENFLLQTNVILEDVLTYLKNSQELQMIKKDDTGDAFDIFLAQSEFIPLEVSGIKVGISIHSARRKINLNDLIKSNDQVQIDRFRSFLSSYNVNPAYIDILKDATSKDNNNLISGFIDENPQIFREYISSYEHLDVINEFYTNTYYDNSLSSIDFKDLFYISEAKSYCIDQNYATEWTKHMLEGIALEDAEDFLVDVNQSNFSSMYCTSNDNRYIIDVNLEIIQGSKTANISFEYNINRAKGYNFSYEI